MTDNSQALAQPHGTQPAKATTCSDTDGMGVREPALAVSARPTLATHAHVFVPPQQPSLSLCLALLPRPPRPWRAHQPASRSRMLSFRNCKKKQHTADNQSLQLHSQATICHRQKLGIIQPLQLQKVKFTLPGFANAPESHQILPKKAIIQA